MDVSFRVFKVWRRNFDVYCTTWHLNFLPPICEPLVYLLAFGAGMGAYVETVPYRGEEIRYAQFLAPGLIAVSVLFQSFGECTYGSYIRMYYQRTFDALLATPVTIDEVIVGELLWGATRALFAVAVMMVVVACFGLLSFPESLILPPVAALGGFMFACMAMCCTALIPTIETLNLPMFFFLVPMFVLSSTFYPTTQLPEWAKTVTQCMPLYHVVELCRAASLGRFHAGMWWNLAIVILLTIPAFAVGLRLMRRRLIK